MECRPVNDVLTRPNVPLYASRPNGETATRQEHNAYRRMNDHLDAVLRKGATLLPQQDPGGSETTVLVAVGAPQVREALAALIGSLTGFLVVGETASGEETIAAARVHHPTLAVVDQDLSHGGGTWAIQTLRAEGLARAIVGIGMRADACTRLRVQAAGAQAYFQTGGSTADVLTALQSALMETVVGPDNAAGGCSADSYPGGTAAANGAVHRNGHSANHHVSGSMTALNGHPSVMHATWWPDTAASQSYHSAPGDERA